MRSSVPFLLALLLTAPALSASEKTPGDAAVPDIAPAIVSEARPGADAALRLTEVAVEERRAPADAAAAQFAPRGSFWWLVGVIVVAAVIVGVLV